MQMYGLLALFNVIFLVNSLPTSKITGGYDASDGKYLYQVSFQLGNVHQCGGAIINKRFILTAANCFLRIPGSYKFDVVVGTNSLDTPGLKYKIKNVVNHNYDTWLRTDDIALVEIEGEFEFNARVQYINTTKVDPKDGYPATFIGWGELTADGPAPKKLQEIELKTIDDDVCRESWLVWHGHICTMGGAGPCYGDSGSPLVADGVLIGIASYGSPCGGKKPSVFTRVYYYLDWIEHYSKL